MPAGPICEAGGPVKKKYDPLWEVVDEKIGLQGEVGHSDAGCPHCHVVVHLQAGTMPGDRFCCGLCGTLCEVIEGAGAELPAAREVAE
jgi:hypothetical protein